MYSKMNGRVRLNGVESNKFDWNKGLKQGDSLSPLIFNLIMDQITKESNNKLRHIKTKIGYYNLQPIYIQSLTYADDIVLVADTEQKLQEIVRVWTENLKAENLNINTGKSKIMLVTKKKEEEIVTPKIKIDNKELEVVKQYKYLGTVFNTKGKINEEIKNRLSQASKVYHQINRTIISKKEI